MATSQKTADFLTEQLAGAGDVRHRRMFGEYALYCDDVVVALICDNQFFLKITDAGRALLHQPVEASPYPGAKPYFLITEDDWDNRDMLCEIVKVTRQALPMPKSKHSITSKGRKK